MFASDFLCGAVEGFYGRPWTPEQRRSLFSLMQRLGLNTYMYAPKDDCKHRAFWRDLYSVEEAEHLTSLISAAKDHDILFVYALSPGLDITFSNAKEVTCLNRKLEQVSQFGCEAFALLFDDIDTEMCVADTEVFQSFAQAQVSVTNEAFQYLGQPKFLFCPTEYCATRAQPSVKSSEYLQTIGSKLLPDIMVMWTGGKVVSKFITIESIKELSSVIKRKPVIWDNIHANDYDQQRMYIGPYKGRSTELKPYTSGVLTNPNCEYYLNHIALHTLATWNKAAGTGDGKKDEPPGDMTEEATISADEQLETEGKTEPGPRRLRINHGNYDPDLALKLAIADWIPMFHQLKVAGVKKVPVIPPIAPIPLPVPVLPVVAPPIQSVNTCMSVTPTTNTSFPASLEVIPQVAAEILKKREALDPLGIENYIPPSNIVNSLISQPPPPGIEDTLEPMECNGDNSQPTVLRTNEAVAPIIPTKGSSSMPTNTTTSSKVTDIDMHEVDIADKQEVDIADKPPIPKAAEGPVASDSSPDGTADCEMQVDSSTDHPVGGDNRERKTPLREKITEEDLNLMCELFYLPYEHGPIATQNLEEIHWLRNNAYVVRAGKGPVKGSEEKAAEWEERATRFLKFCKDVKQLMTRLLHTPNRSLLYDIYPYMWDMEIAVSMIGSFIKWLAVGLLPETSCGCMDVFYSWCTTNHKQAFLSGDNEPWMFRGGLTGEFHRMLTLESAADLLVRQQPRQVCSRVFTIRPFLPKDEEAVYKMCSLKYSDDKADMKSFDDYPRLLTDKYLGLFVTLSPEYCFVLEESECIVGYVLAALDIKTFKL
ncbi:protein O-GlcNAcase isoform X3 [Strongylocentrotus purpuratus]|uniref:protein O-GlcNAcase n=1 Tax=Strongylocentrotus purpuratus TaxID=7668 RepID=A0A7M7NXR5_STRPU|nr:protein O-GlcNAcase isoform X3 [Strongylocentrotus purpuratus]